MFRSREERKFDRELEARRVRDEAQAKATEKADKETARKFQARTDAAVKRNDFSELKAITEEARAKGFENRVIDSRIRDHEWEEEKQREKARRASLTEKERHAEDSSIAADAQATWRAEEARRMEERAEGEARSNGSLEG